jgi:hypothetical protein
MDMKIVINNRIGIALTQNLAFFMVLESPAFLILAVHIVGLSFL